VDKGIIEVEVEVEVNLRPTISRPVCPGVRCPSGTCDQFFFLLEISFRQLRVRYFVAPSLTRGWVCNLLYNSFWACLARAVTVGSKSRRTHGHILLSHLRLPKPGGPGSRIYIPQELGGPVIPPGTGFASGPHRVLQWEGSQSDVRSTTRKCTGSTAAPPVCE
jgi:hypothetical protein